MLSRRTGAGPAPGVDFKGLLPLVKRKRVGIIGVRVLAAGALNGASAGSRFDLVVPAAVAS